jgi:hypothetical protein
VVDASVPLSVNGIVWSGVVSLKMYRLPVVPGGMKVPDIVIGTAEAVVIVVSGNVKGLALIAVPLILVTLTPEAPPTGRARLYGTE